MISNRDRLHVFVSSTIKECAAERASVKQAIRSINHEPVLFEEIGARPHPPREVYTVRLEMSQIFVGIYRESYGWIAPGMDKSGVEDEFCIAGEHGLDRLIYIYKSPLSRDSRLQDLIELAKNSGLTIATYADPQQLEDLVRNDVTAVVSNRFVSQAVVSREAPKAVDVLDSLLPNHNHRFRRRQIERELLKALEETRRLLITAPLGGGKTVLLAQLSVNNGWLFVDGQGLSRFELLARIANTIREHSGKSFVTLATESNAVQEILMRLEEIPDTRLAIDGAIDPLVFWDLAKDHRLVLTSRSMFEVPHNEHFEVPLLTRSEIEDWVTGLRGIRPGAAELSRLASQSGGNPLYLRFFALGASEDLPLRELELRALQALPPRAKEITSYLVLADSALSLGDLHALIDADDGPEGVAEQISVASGLLRQNRNQVQLVHEHLRETLLDHLHQAPARLAFFASRLGRYFENSKRFVAAFHVYCEAGEERLADRVLGRAAHQASVMGGGAPAVSIFKRQLQLAREGGDLDRQVSSLLNLSVALKQTGLLEDAGRALADARIAAKRESSRALLLRVEAAEIVTGAEKRPRADRINELESLRRSYLETDEPFEAARLGTVLGAEYIAGSDFAKAEDISREVLRVFEGLGDEYGVRIARINLAAALSSIDGREQEAMAMARELQQEIDPEESPRERAVLCNLLTRYYRELGDTSRASEFALEAIRIGEQQKNFHVIAINRLNLGNVRRDEGALDQALIEYAASEQAAVAGGLGGSEAAANEVIASVHNERQEYRVALHHAQHSAAVARMVGDHFLIARAEEECAIALNGQRDIDGAIGAYAAAVKAIGVFHPGESFFVSLIDEALKLCATSQRIDLKISLLVEIFAPALVPTTGSKMVDPLRALYAVLPAMARTIGASRLLPVIALTMADLLADLPTAIERRITLQATRAVLDSRTEASTKSTLAAVAGILLTQAGNCLTLGDLVEIAESVARFAPGVYFKPQQDGAACWTIRLAVAGGVTVSLLQLDDCPRTSRTTMVLGLLLASLDDLIGEHLLKVEQLPRQEAIINVASRKELEAQIDPHLMNLGEMKHGFVVTRSTDVTRSDQPPILAVCSEDFPAPWRPNVHALSDVHLIFGEIIRSLVDHLLSKSVEREVLFPKIGALIREIGYRGQADQAYPGGNG